jgi:hypothetical protein
MNSETKNGRSRHGGGRAYHSRLESFVDFIRQQRQQRRTWQEIATLLRTEKGCAITHQGLHQFYRRYLKRKARPHWENAAPAPAMPLPKVHDQSHQPTLAAIPQPRPFRQPNANEITLNDPTNI